jgi:hypothetical protein
MLLRALRDQSGAAIALVALSMVALLSAVALAVDVGMLVTARTESQTLGDAAALAGAGVLRDTNGDSLAAHNAAVAWGAENTVQGESVAILSEDVDVIPDDWTVRVRVRRIGARSNPVPTYFARIFGVSGVDISTTSAAWAAPSTTSEGNGAACGLPLALIDKFDDLNGNGLYEPHLGETIVGYDESDHGSLVKLKLFADDEGGGEPPPFCQTDATNPEVSYNVDYCTEASSSWDCWWRPDHPSEGGGGGVDALGPLIYPGDTCTEDVAIGDIIWAASGDGNKQSLVNGESPAGHTFVDLINADPDKEWCPDCAGDGGCIVEAGTSECVEDGGIRNRSVPVVDPAGISGEGADMTAEVTNHIGVFVEQVSCAYDAGPFNSNYETGAQSGKWNVYVRLTIASGSGSTGEEAGGGSLVRTLQLIE